MKTVASDTKKDTTKYPQLDDKKGEKHPDHDYDRDPEGAEARATAEARAAEAKAKAKAAAKAKAEAEKAKSEKDAPAAKKGAVSVADDPDRNLHPNQDIKRRGNPRFPLAPSPPFGEF